MKSVKQRNVLAALREDRLRTVDQRLARGGGVVAAEEDLSEVGHETIYGIKQGCCACLRKARSDIRAD